MSFDNRVSRSSFTRLPAVMEREWLVTNGLDGFAAGTIAQANTRRYHALLMAALRPPSVAGTSENFGVEQEHLNRVFGAHLRITALRAASGPGIELLEYLTPRTGRAAPADTGADDLWYWQINLQGPDPTELERGLRAAHVERLSAPVAAAADGLPEFPAGVIVRDPDGHANLIEP